MSQRCYCTEFRDEEPFSNEQLRSKDESLQRTVAGDDAPTATEDSHVHPEAVSLFQLCPLTKKIPLFTPSCEAFGPKGVVALGLCYFLNKGIGSYLVRYCRYAMFRSRFGIDGTRYQRLSALYTLGWSIKACSASISDTFALFGYTKRWYCAASSVFGAAFALGFGLLPAKESSANIGAGFMFLTNFFMANIDILSEGHYSRIMRKRPAAGPALVSWIWVFIFVAAIVSAGVQGPLSDRGIPQVGLLVSAACQALTVFFFIFNWYGERYNCVERREDFSLRHSEVQPLNYSNGLKADTAAILPDKNPQSERASNADPKPLTATSATAPQRRGDKDDFVIDGLVRSRPYDDAMDDIDVDHSAYVYSLCPGVVEINREVFFRNWRLFVYSAVMVCAVIVQCLVTVFGKSTDLGYSSLVVAVVCCSLAFWACSLVAAKAICFLYLDMLLYVQLPGAMDSFYMSTKECYPAGPHFTFVFYNTMAAIIGNVAGIAGVTAFSYFFSKRSYCFTFIITTIVKVLGSVFDIVMVKRWNLAIGIPDHAMYIMGDAIVYEACNQLAWMPVVLLFSRICPRGSESMIYALAAGFSNMGQSMSSTVGSLLMELVWPIQTTGVNGCNFDNVPMLLVFAHVVFPLGVIPLSFLLLPRARICDDIGADGRSVSH